jgi:hypothetical protein
VRDIPQTVGYDVGMALSVVVAVILGVQPVCGEATYRTTLEPSLHGDAKMVGRAIFDAYLEQVAQLDKNQTAPESRVEVIKARQITANNADALFDSLLESLSVLSEESSLQSGIMAARRTVLLDARQANNPWPETKWFDIAAIVQTNPEFLNIVDSFLLQYADTDRDDRFNATIAKLEGDRVACAEAERRTMQRWAIYDKLIEPFENGSTLEYRFSSIPKSGQVTNLYIEITDSIKDPTVTDIVRNQMVLYKTLYEKQKHSLIKLIKDARINEGVDPLSTGCGSVGLTRNLILQRSAEIHELNRSTVESMLRSLSNEQRQELGY